MRGELDTLAFSRLAARQHGVISRGQLRQLGFGDKAIDNRICNGWLHPVHRGVFAVGHRRLAVRGRWMAAVLACGDGAVLSHMDAAALWDLRRSSAYDIHVTVPSSAGRAARSGVVLHRRGALHRDDVTVNGDIPVTSVALTLLDLAGKLPKGPLERTVERATFLRLLDVNAMDTTLARNPGRKGATGLKAILRNVHHEPKLTRSKLEGFFIDLCDSHALPKPEINEYVEGIEVDFFWRRHRLIIEADGRETHATPMAFERDRARDARLMLAGYRVVRFTYRQIVYERDSVARTVLGLLAAPLAA